MSSERHASRIDWDAKVKLAVVVSAVAALLAVAFAEVVSGPVLIAAVLVAGSVLSWRTSGALASPTMRHRAR